VAELADAGGLNPPSPQGSTGSSPVPGTGREMELCDLGRLLTGSDRRSMCTKCAQIVGEALWGSLTEEEQARVGFHVDRLAASGPLLDEPHTKQLDGKLR
jgi:hypothetical protein